MPASPAQNVEISYHAAVLDAAAVRDGSCRRPRRRLPPPQPARVLTTHRQEGYGICACRHVPCRTSHPDQPSCVLPPTLDAEMPRGAPGSAHSAATAPTAPTPTSGIPPARRGRRHQRCGATVIRSDLRALKVAAAIAGAAFSPCPPPPPGLHMTQRHHHRQRAEAARSGSLCDQYPHQDDSSPAGLPAGAKCVLVVTSRGRSVLTSTSSLFAMRGRRTISVAWTRSWRMCRSRGLAAPDGNRFPSTCISASSCLLGWGPGICDSCRVPSSAARISEDKTGTATSTEGIDTPRWPLRPRRVSLTPIPSTLSLV